MSTTWAAWEAIKAGETHCTQCDDTGWQILTHPRRARGEMADWMVAHLDPHLPRPLAKPCPVYHEDATVTSAQPCACRATNPLYQARRAAERRTAGGGEA